LTTDWSITTLIGNASVGVQIILTILILTSVLSWAAIFDRARMLWQAQRAIMQFEQQFWSGGDLTTLYHSVLKQESIVIGLGAIFRSGFKEYIKLRKGGSLPTALVLQSTERAMYATLNREIGRLEKQLTFLATVGSTSPYIGLLGTVWGIMNTFYALGQTQQAALDVVAPGIAEALIATAMGLVTAIPAVVAYNRYRSQIDQLSDRYEEFIAEFTNLLQRQDDRPASQ
jgi:biopolymer transport protein TolQ